jgi:hypothetical protein
MDYEISIFPNPASDNLNIVSNRRIVEIQIMNNLGQVVYEAHPDQNSIAVDVSTLPGGIYHIAVRSQNDIVTIKKLSIH